MPYEKVDPDRLKIRPLKMRRSKTNIEDIALDPDSIPAPAPEIQRVIGEVAERLFRARKRNASVMIAFGAHLVKNGAGPILIKLMENGWITHLATQGAGSIHDWEFAYHGRSEEDVRANVADGSFGTWDETGKYTNLAVQVGAVKGLGYGESIGALIHHERLEIPDPEQLHKELMEGLTGRGEFLQAKLELLETVKKYQLKKGILKLAHPFQKYSIFGNGYRLKIPVTVHPGIGYDIIYNHPFASGGALGRGGHIDFRIFVHSVLNLSDGVFLSLGSAVMAPQIFEKALSFANNIKLQTGESVHDFYILINDIQKSLWDWEGGEPDKDSPNYYLRFLKSFYRMGGTTRYVKADNRVFLHHLYWKLKEKGR